MRCQQQPDIPQLFTTEILFVIFSKWKFVPWGLRKSPRKAFDRYFDIKGKPLWYSFLSRWESCESFLLTFPGRLRFDCCVFPFWPRPLLLILPDCLSFPFFFCIFTVRPPGEYPARWKMILDNSTCFLPCLAGPHRGLFINSPNKTLSF